MVTLQNDRVQSLRAVLRSIQDGNAQNTRYVVEALPGMKCRKRAGVRTGKTRRNAGAETNWIQRREFGCLHAKHNSRAGIQFSASATQRISSSTYAW